MRMTKRILISGCILFVVLMVAFSVKKEEQSSKKDHLLPIESVAFNTPSGWGYNILVDHKIFIHQEFIPAIAGKKSFSNKDDAMKTASLVVQKLEQSKSPRITVGEIAALKISY
jgi:hypothetical protein